MVRVHVPQQVIYLVDMKKSVLKHALINATLTSLYIILVASFLFYIPRYFNLAGKPDTVLAPIMMLMLFVFSAATTGTLVFGRPILWYMDNNKKDAISLLLYTLSILFVVMILAFVVLVNMA